MKIGFATQDFGLVDNTFSIGGSGWYRMALPARELARLGHEVWIGTLMQHPHTHELLVCPVEDREHAHGGFDIIVLQRWMNHDLPAAIARARAQGQVVVQDLDDWFWGLSPHNRAFRATDPRTNPLANRDHYRKVLARSSAVTVSTPFLAEKVLEMLPGMEVWLLRNAIDLERWTPREETGDERTLGWVGAMPWRSGDIESVQGVVGQWCNAQGWRFHHGGHTPHLSEQSAGELLGATDCSFAEFAPIHEYPVLYQPLDVGIVPLAPIPFNDAKSAIKGLEYAASGVPFVASASAEYRWLYDLGMGRLARRPRDWQRELNRMLDPAFRADQRAANLDLVQQWNITVRVQEWLDAYAHLALAVA